MAEKMSPARRAAFMAAVAETGNQTIAAERAKVSRSWVVLHRRTDPAFRAELDAAIATAKARFDTLRADGSDMTPAAGWRSIQGEELVVRGGNGRLVQVARARPRQWTPRVEARFLAALASCCNVKAACRAAGLSTAAAYRHYHRWPDFEKRWNAALEEGYMRLELALIENAGRAFAAVDYPPDMPIEPMTFDQAITLLHHHQLRVHGAGKQQGVRRAWRPRSSEDAFASLAHKLDRMEKRLRAKEAGDPAADPGANQRALARGARIVARRG
jgi:hypothetical protein